MPAPYQPIELAPHTSESFELEAMAKELMKSDVFESSGRLARTLARGERLTAVLTVIRRGAEIHEHTTPGPAAVTVLFGKVVFSFGASGAEKTLDRRSALVFSGDAAHGVKALEDSAFLIVIGGRKED